MAERKKLSESPGVVPGTAKYLEHADPDGNQLWRVVVMKN
jgi:V-type H+-transporting ATPase subunit C